MAEKAKAVDPDAPNDDIETISADEQAALDDRSTVGDARREDDAQVIARDEKPAPEAPAKAAAKETVKPAEAEVPAKAEAAKDEPRHVPLATLLEERKEFQRKLDEQRTQLEGKLDIIMQRREKPAEAPKPLDVDANPLEALKQTRQELQQVQQLQVNQSQRLQFANHVSAQVGSFKAQTPDYDAAYKFAVDSTRAELKARGYSDVEIPAILENGEFQLAQEALQRGKNPGQHFYEFAQARGYKKAEPAPQPAPQEQQPATASERIETANRGQQASKSLSGAGSAPPAKLTLADIDSMSEDDIAAMPEDKFRALFG